MGKSRVFDAHTTRPIGTNRLLSLGAETLRQKKQLVSGKHYVLAVS